LWKRFSSEQQVVADRPGIVKGAGMYFESPCRKQFRELKVRDAIADQRNEKKIGKGYRLRRS
jgi:hypothetical protein